MADSKNCLWKIVAENDSKKMQTNTGEITLNPETSSQCYECDGKNNQCQNYTPNL